jgi:hypothetical protein
VKQSLAGSGKTAGWRAGLGGFELSGRISPPRALAFMAFEPLRYQLEGPAEVVAVARHAFVASHDMGLQVLDVRWPDDIRHRAVLGLEGLDRSNTLVAIGETLLVGTDTGLRAVDVSHPAAPAVVARGAEALAIQHAALAGDHLVAASGERLLLYDVSTPRSPRLADSLALGNRSPTPGATPGPCAGVRCLTPGVPAYGELPRLAVNGRRLFAALPDLGLNELVIRDGPRPTGTGTAVLPTGTPAATDTATARPSPSASATREAATPTRTAGRPGGRVLFLPLAGNGE